MPKRKGASPTPGPHATPAPCVVAMTATSARRSDLSGWPDFRRESFTLGAGRAITKPTRLPLASSPAHAPEIVEVLRTEEKGSDVNLATYLLLDAFREDAEVAVVVSDDFDLKEPLRVTRHVLGRTEECGHISDSAYGEGISEWREPLSRTRAALNTRARPWPCPQRARDPGRVLARPRLDAARRSARSRSKRSSRRSARCLAADVNRDTLTRCTARLADCLACAYGHPYQHEA